MVMLLLLWGCSNNGDEPSSDDPTDSFFQSVATRQFQMGFTSWPYAPTIEAVISTNSFIEVNGDIYGEHIDSEIPWNAWINDTALPDSFIEMVSNRVMRRASGQTLTLSISLLNLDRADLFPDFDGTVPAYNSLDDAHIVDAHRKHVNYLVEQLSPEYLVIAVEVDGLLKNAPEKWEAYKSLISDVKSRIKTDYPTLPISESMMLHNYYNPNFGDAQTIITEVSNYMNTMDFAAISFYPFLKNLKTTAEFQEAFDFLHEQVDVPISFAETGHLSEDLTVEGFNLFIAGNELEQNDYMQTLLTNAQDENYEYVIWWTHRDYEPLWETFPENLKDLGALWLSNGILDEDGSEKEAYSSWEGAFSK